MFIEFERGLTDAKRWFRHSNICLRNLFGKTVGMARTVPVNPRTDDQTAARDSMKAAGQAWRSLPEADRDTWNAYARRYGSEVSDQRYKDLSGWEFFLPAWRNRALLDTDPDILPANAAPPPPVVAVEELFSGDPQTYTFRITHNAVPDGHVLLVRMTPQTATRARKPFAAQARMIRGHCRESALALPVSGETITFTGARFIVEKGQRFGLALRIVRVDDGVHSREFFADMYRGGDEQADVGEPAPESGPPAGEVAVPDVSHGEDSPILVQAQHASPLQHDPAYTSRNLAQATVITAEYGCTGSRGADVSPVASDGFERDTLKINFAKSNAQVRSTAFRRKGLNHRLSTATSSA